MQVASAHKAMNDSYQIDINWIISRPKNINKYTTQLSTNVWYSEILLSLFLLIDNAFHVISKYKTLKKCIIVYGIYLSLNELGTLGT